MKIAMGSDHGGYELKEVVKKWLTEKGYEVTDYGIGAGETADYPDMAEVVCRNVVKGEQELGILFCGTGIGISMAANKIKGIRAALISDAYSAKMTREHNNANVLCLGGRTIGPDLACHMIDSFLSAEFQGGRHQRRVDKITNLEG